MLSVALVLTALLTPPWPGCVLVAAAATVAGTSKLFDWPVAAFAAPSVGSWPIWWAGVIETIAGTLILLGLGTLLLANWKNRKGPAVIDSPDQSQS